MHVLAQAPANWTAERGFVDARLIRDHVPDYRERVFYVSGPQAMVSATVRSPPAPLR